MPLNPHQINRQASQSRLSVAIIITFVFMVVEFTGGWFSHSLALISDAGHMLNDLASLSLSLLAIRFATQSSTPKKTYGFYRVEILSALLNGVALVSISFFILHEAYLRFHQTIQIDHYTMIAVGVLGLAANIVSALILRQSQKQSLTVHSAYMHVISDLLGSVGVIIAGGIIWWSGWTPIDLIISGVICILIMASAWRILKETIDILLEGTPKGIRLESVENAIKTIEGVESVHDLHIWTITSGFIALSSHVRMKKDFDLNYSQAILNAIRNVLKEGFEIEHITVQIEPDPELKTPIDFIKPISN